MPDLLQGFTMPKALVVNEATATPTYAKFAAEPLEKGFGNTLGNALRRVLLSSMEGVAVSSLRIDGVQHEFSCIPHVVEDITEIVLNIKKLKLQSAGDMPRNIELFADRAGPVKASAIKEDGVTTVLNPDLVICTIDKDTVVHMEMSIDRGRGFRPAEENKKPDQPIGVIPVDCLFSPVERVRYDVQACRVGQRTDYDRLEIEVWTDGRILPQDALFRSVNLLREHLAIFVPPEAQEEPVVQITTEEDQALVNTLCTSVNELELSVRARNCLNTAHIRHLGQLVENTESEMLKYRNFGKKSLQEIKTKLTKHGLSLGMVLKDEVRAAFKKQTEDLEEKKEE